MDRLTRAVAGLDDVVREAREGRGLLHALVYDPQATEVLARLDRTSVELEDPTIYQDLSTLLRGANRSWLLRGLIRSTVEEGQKTK